MLYKEDDPESGFDVVVCSACMIKGHFTNTCFEEFLKVLKPGGCMIFSIRVIYLNKETDNGMNYIGKINELLDNKAMTHVSTSEYMKYEGL